MSTLSPLIGLVATQYLLYAAGWGLCSLLIRGERQAIAHWVLFMAFVGIGFALAGLRTEPRTLLAYPVSNIAFLAGFVALSRGLEHFVRLPPADRWHLPLFGLSAAGLLALGADAAYAVPRVTLAYLVSAAIVGLAVHRVLPRAIVEFGRLRFLAVASPAFALVAYFLLRAARQLIDPSHPLEMHLSSAENHRVLNAYLVGAAMFNFSFVALIVSRLLHHLRDQVRRDALTGLPNRRAFDQELAREWQRLRRGGGAYALLALDLDHFKQVNDLHGHLAGDAVLEETGRRLLAVARGTDVVARVGGEEFLVLVPGAGWHSATAAAERLRGALASRAFEVHGLRLPVTASVGVTLARADDDSPQQALQRADAALYRAKAAGRNRVVALDPGGDAAPARV